MTESGNSNSKILIAPLNWGLGHASRCIPIIRFLISNQIELLIACGQPQKAIPETEFPSLRFINLPGYDLQYGKSRMHTLLKIIFQIPKILIRIKKENRWLKDFLAKEKIAAVISDNRYGLFSTNVFSVFITHQLKIQVPFGKKMEQMIQRINYKYINRFSECWVPDFEKEPSLAGDLSHPDKLTETHIRYIGCISRFRKTGASVIDGSLLIILSGPEPQRTILEKKLLDQLRFYSGNATLVRGVPGENKKPNLGSNIVVYNHLASAELNKIICESEFVICRSGYSSIMDIVKLEKKSIVIPTPGQTEQEYLAHYLFGKKTVFSVDQKDFLLNDALENAKKFSYQKNENIDDSLMEQALMHLVASIKK